MAFEELNSLLRTVGCLLTYWLISPNFKAAEMFRSGITLNPKHVQHLSLQALGQAGFTKRLIAHSSLHVGTGHHVWIPQQEM